MLCCLISKWKSEESAVYSLCLCHTQRHLLSGGRNIRLWDLDTHEVLQVRCTVAYWISEIFWGIPPSETLIHWRLWHRPQGREWREKGGIGRKVRSKWGRGWEGWWQLVLMNELTLSPKTARTRRCRVNDQPSSTVENQQWVMSELCQRKPQKQ